MIKARKKWLSVLLTVAMLAALLVPLATPAQAAATYSMSNVQKVSAGYSGPIGTLVITMDAGTAIATTGKYVYFDLPTSPTGYEIFPGTPIGGQITPSAATNYFSSTNVTITKTSTTQFKVYADTTGVNGDPSKDSLIAIPLRIKVPSGVSGDINLTASAPSSSTFSSGTITIARVGTKSVTLSVESIPAISSAGGAVGVIDLKEDTNGSLTDTGSTEALKLTLPPGFKWNTPTASDITFMWGDSNLISNLKFTVDNDGRDLKIHNTYSTGSATFIKLNLSITVDESVAKAGDVKVTISGATSASPSEIVVARYGEYGATVKAYSCPDIVAGKAAVDIGKLEIDENIPGSLIEERTITLTLPDNAKWAQFPTIDTDLSQNYGNIQITWTVVGSDAKMIKGTVHGSTAGQTDPAKIVLKNMQVTTAPDFSGDLKVEVGGSQGISGTVVLAKVKSPITVTASATPEVIIGKDNQAAGDITITENLAEAIKGTPTYSYYDSATGLIADTTTSGNAWLILKAPAGVTFSSTPKVEVVSGDLQIDPTATKTDTTDAHEGLLYIKIKSSSTTPSTIKISDIKLTVDRTVPEGPLALSVRGNAVNETLDENGNDTIFPGHKDAASVVVAKCVTPAPTQAVGKAIFKIGEAKYTVDGKEYTMDAAAYIENDRAFAPLRYVAYAAGVTQDNILWNPATRTATFIKGDRVVQVTADSNVLVVNGTQITMDVNAVIKEGRFFLPVRWLSVALGCQVDWDAQNQQVIVTRTQ